MPDPTDLIRRSDAIAAIPNGWHGQPHRSNMDYGPNVSVQAIAAIRALPAISPQEPPSPGVTAGAAMIDGADLMYDPGVGIEAGATGAMTSGNSGQHVSTPAPVVPAEGLDALLMDLHDLASDAYDNGKEHESNTMIRAYDAITALRSAPPVGARVTGWQPIETAPKDGTPVDLWCLNLLHYAKRGFRKTNVSWGTVTDWFGTEREDWRHGRGEDIQPTHWMPLPEPPAALLPAGEGE